MERKGLRDKYELLTHIFAVRKYDNVEPIEFSIGNKTFPIIKDEDDDLIYYQLKNMQEWFRKNAGVSPSCYTHFHSKLHHSPIIIKGGGLSYKSSETKLLLEDALNRLPYDTVVIEEFIKNVTIVNANVLLRMISYLVCCAILVDEADKDKAKEEYDVILNATYKIMKAFEEKLGHESDILYDKLNKCFAILYTICGLSHGLYIEDFNENTRIRYIKAILKTHMVSKYHKLDIRTFRRLIDCYYGRYYSDAETYLFINSIYHQYPFLNNIPSYVEYRDSVYPNHNTADENGRLIK